MGGTRPGRPRIFRYLSLFSPSTHACSKDTRGLFGDLLWGVCVFHLLRLGVFHPSVCSKVMVRGLCCYCVFHHLRSGVRPPPPPL